MIGIADTVSIQDNGLLDQLPIHFAKLISSETEYLIQENRQFRAF